MDDLDIGGIDEILKQAAKIRNDAKSGYLYNDVSAKHIGSYQCNGCGEENSLLSSWCFKCGLPKFGSPPKPKMSHCFSEGDTKYNVYNTDQILQSKPIVTPADKPREINTTKNIVKGEVKVFEYNQSKENKQNITGVKDMSVPEIDEGSSMENVGSEAEFLECPSFSSEDIIYYDRCETKKSKKRLYIKPLSTPSLLSSTFSPTATKNAWPTPVTKQTKPSATPLRVKNGRPNSASNGRPNSASNGRSNSASNGRPNSTSNGRPNSASKSTPQIRANSLARKNFPTLKHHNSTCSKKSLNNSLTPSVFERLYSNETKPKIRTVQSSPHLIGTEKNKNMKTNAVVALAAPQLSFQSTDKKSKIFTEEELIINNRRKAKKNTFPKQMCAAPLAVSGIRSNLPKKYPVSIYYRGIEENCPVQWTSLPAEIWVKIMGYISHGERVELTVSCSYLQHVAADFSIWSRITVSGRDLTDTHLQAIGERSPKYLTFSSCNGEKLSPLGFRSLFRNCSASLKGLTITDCKGGDLVSASLLLHLSARCRDLTSLHLSLCNLGDEALTQLAQRTHRLEQLCIPMCSGVSDTSFRVLLQRHYRYLTCLDITGCYHISSVAISQISLCPNLTSLYLGNCNQIHSATIHTLSAKLDKLLILDIRGCKNVSSDSVMDLLKANPHIHTLSLSHVAMVTDVVLEQIARTLLSLNVLDLSGCIKVTSIGIQYLVKHPLSALDLGSTAVSFRGCCAISNYLCTTLKQVSFNFCSDVNDECVRKIVQKCKKLERVSIFGCSYIRNLSNLSRLNAGLVLDF